MPSVGPGARGRVVVMIQRALRAHGFDPGAVDGVYGANTLRAVVRFQRSSGLVADGLVGSRTIAALGLASPWGGGGADWDDDDDDGDDGD